MWEHYRGEIILGGNPFGRHLHLFSKNVAERLAKLILYGTSNQKSRSILLNLLFSNKISYTRYCNSCCWPMDPIKKVRSNCCYTTRLICLIMEFYVKTWLQFMPVKMNWRIVFVTYVIFIHLMCYVLIVCF